MDDTQKLLQSIVENARTGLDACDQLMTQREQYQTFAHNAEKALYAAGGRPHAKSPMGRMGMWMGIQMNTLTDDSASHIAEMLIEGATMGVIEMTRDRDALSGADAGAQGIASDFIAAQQNNIEAMKQFI